MQFLLDALSCRQLSVPIAGRYSNRILESLLEDNDIKFRCVAIDILWDLHSMNSLWKEENTIDPI